jgi:hypothetical protein
MNEPVDIRDVTDEETAAFRARGWAFVPGLLTEAEARDLARRARDLVGADARHVAREGIDLPPEVVGNAYSSFSNAWDADPRFHDLSRAPGLGRLAARLLGRDCEFRFGGDAVLTKQPAGGTVSRPTFVHQDQSFLPFDRTSLTVWIALDEVTPDMGPLQFRSGSHHVGPLGRTVRLDEWVQLEDCPESAAHHMRPGDATVHHSLTFHGTSANSSDRVRWAYVAGVIPADTLYTGLPVPEYNGLGLQPLQPFDHPHFPVIYTPAGVSA